MEITDNIQEIQKLGKGTTILVLHGAHTVEMAPEITKMVSDYDIVLIELVATSQDRMRATQGANAVSQGIATDSYKKTIANLKSGVWDTVLNLEGSKKIIGFVDAIVPEDVSQPEYILNNFSPINLFAKLAIEAIEKNDKDVFYQGINSVFQKSMQSVRSRDKLVAYQVTDILKPYEAKYNKPIKSIAIIVGFAHHPETFLQQLLPQANIISSKYNQETISLGRQVSFLRLMTDKTDHEPLSSKEKTELFYDILYILEKRENINHSDFVMNSTSISNQMVKIDLQELIKSRPVSDVAVKQAIDVLFSSLVKYVQTAR